MDFGDKFRVVRIFHNVMFDLVCPLVHYHARVDMGGGV